MYSNPGLGLFLLREPLWIKRDAPGIRPGSREAPQALPIPYYTCTLCGAAPTLDTHLLSVYVLTDERQFCTNTLGGHGVKLAVKCRNVQLSTSKMYRKRPTSEWHLAAREVIGPFAKKVDEVLAFCIEPCG